MKYFVRNVSTKVWDFREKEHFCFAAFSNSHLPASDFFLFHCDRCTVTSGAIVQSTVVGCRQNWPFGFISFNQFSRPERPSAWNMTCTGLRGYGKKYIKFRSILGNGIIHCESNSSLLFNYMLLKQPDYFPTESKEIKVWHESIRRQKWADWSRQRKFNKITHAFRGALRVQHFVCTINKTFRYIYNSRYGSISAFGSLEVPRTNILRRGITSIAYSGREKLYSEGVE